MRRIPQGQPTVSRISEVRVAGFSQRRVWADDKRVDFRMERPKVERSLADEYMPPALDYMNKCLHHEGSLLTESRHPAAQPIAYLSTYQGLPQWTDTG